MCCQNGSSSKKAEATLESRISNETLVNTYFDSTSNAANMRGKVTTNVIGEWFLCNNLAIIFVMNRYAQCGAQRSRHLTQFCHQA